MQSLSLVLLDSFGQALMVFTRHGVLELTVFEDSCIQQTCQTHNVLQLGPSCIKLVVWTTILMYTNKYGGIYIYLLSGV